MTTNVAYWLTMKMYLKLNEYREKKNHVSTAGRWQHLRAVETMHYFERYDNVMTQTKDYNVM